MAKVTAAIITATALLVLSGCAAGGAAAGGSDAAAESAPPLVAATEAPTPTASADDEQYLAEVRLRLQNLPDATDEQLLVAAHEACDVHYPAGLTRTDMRFVDGEQPDESGTYRDSNIIATWAAKVYCPEYDD